MFQNVALLSLSNILHKCGKLEEALLVTNMALEADSTIVAAHFTMANIYAAKVCTTSHFLQNNIFFNYFLLVNVVIH